jgi:hypothetical protein
MFPDPIGSNRKPRLWKSLAPIDYTCVEVVNLGGVLFDELFVAATCSGIKDGVDTNLTIRI